MTLFQKIRASELPEVFARCIIVGSRCIFWRSEISKSDEFSLNADHASPKVTHYVATFMHAFESSSTNPLILDILRHSTRAKIFTAIIQRIVIAMVTFQSRWSVGYKPMHEYRTTSGHVMNSYPCFCRFDELRLPRPLRQPVKVGCVNNRCPVASKGDISKRFVQRLNNFMPSLYWHWGIA